MFSLSFSARGVGLPKYQPPPGYFYHKRLLQSLLDVWSWNDWKHGEHCGGIQRHQAATCECYIQSRKDLNIFTYHSCYSGRQYVWIQHDSKVIHNNTDTLMGYLDRKSYFDAMISFIFHWCPQPIRICLAGPPAVGKSTVAERLCSHYQINHIKIKEIIEEKMAHLVSGLKGL